MLAENNNRYWKNCKIRTRVKLQNSGQQRQVSIPKFDQLDWHTPNSNEYASKGFLRHLSVTGASCSISNISVVV